MKTTKIMRLVAVLLLTVCAAGLFAGCGAKDNTNSSDAVHVYETALDILSAVWEGTDKEFPAFGGNIENNTADEPGRLDPADTDTMTAMLLIPENVQSHVADAATLFHMMNANTFTGAALKLEGISADDAASQIKESFKNNPFMCGVPDKIVIYAFGSDIVYFFGAADILDGFMEAAARLDGAKLLADEAF